MKNKYDKWHFIIPFITMLILCPIASKGVIFSAIGTLIIVQFVYEWLQMRKVGKVSFERFRENSKIDILYFIIGTFLGTFGGLLIKGILHAVQHSGAVSGLPSSGL